MRDPIAIQVAGRYPVLSPLSKILVSILACSLLAACATSPTGRRQLMLISPDAAIVQSKQAYLSTVSDLSKEDKLLDDPKLAQRVATITGRLVTVAIAKYPNSANWEWSVAIVDDPETVNAWCMAGGRMAVYSGLFEKLKLTDSEFAQIMGHEISHALANHTAERMSRAMATSIGVLAIGVASDRPAATMAGGAVAAKLALELPNSRTAEAEADRIGMELAVLAGFDPDAAVTLWRKMGALGGSKPPAFLSTHPAPGNREATLAEMIPQMRKLNPTGKLAPVTAIEIIQDVPAARTPAKGASSKGR
ncbi:MAG: M48 family metallopeptidase [Halioglobus sp.]|nr:M48 family metallopeptidase [Halioglobus sp.]